MNDNLSNPNSTQNAETLPAEVQKRIYAIKDDGDIKEWVDATFPYGHKRTVHIHFLDFGDPTESEKLSVNMMGNLAKHLKTLSQYSDGVIMTCAGQKGKSHIVGRVIEKLATDTNVPDFSFGNRRSLVIALGEPGKWEQVYKVDQNKEGMKKLMGMIHHVLQMDGKKWPPNKARQIQDIREAFISLMTSLPRNSLLQTQEEATPAVCVLVDSGEESLKVALMAQSRDIPLIVMNGSDGGLNYLVQLHEKMIIRWERQRVGNEIRHVAVPVLDSTTSVPLEVSDKSKELLDKLKQFLPLITIYNPEEKEGKSLDAVILEALIINKKEKEMSAFLKSMIDNKDTSQSSNNTSDQTFIHNRDLQWDYFIRSLKDGGSAAVKAFLGCLQLDCDDFHFGKILKLYDSEKKTFIRSQKPIAKLRQLPETPKSKAAKAALIRFYKARRDLYKYLQKPALFPLPCQGIGCQHCTIMLDHLKDNGNIIEKVKAERWQTCLHPVQELFLWSLLCSNSDVTTALWEYTKDRMGAALFASAVYSGIAKREKKYKKMDTSYQLKEDSRRFKQLAIWTLTSSTEMGEHKTDVLLRKPCPWWSPTNKEDESRQADAENTVVQGQGQITRVNQLPNTCPLTLWSSDPGNYFTVLDVALQTSCKAFIAQGMPQQLMSLRWLESPNYKIMPQVNTVDGKEENKEEKEEESPQCCANLSCCKHFKGQYLYSTRARYLVCIVWQLAFILLFSYVLLMGLTGTIHGANLALIVWVGDILIEEIRQWQSINVRFKNQRKDCCACIRNAFSLYRTKCKEYFNQGWNKLDAVSIAIFVVGTLLAFCRNNYRVHDAGRLFLAVDMVFFILRFLQVFIVFKKPGLWLIMAKDMAKDTMYFMGILLSIAYGYAVASESLLKSDETQPDWYKVPRKAFFSMFGDFALDDIEDKNTSPTTWQWVPVYLGIFLVMTNVLLLNLLIARLNSLYNKMEIKTMEYQAWQTCQAVLEFEHRSWLPPPCNILRALCALLWAVTCRSLCRSSSDEGSNSRQNSVCCCSTRSKNTTNSSELTEEVLETYRMQGTCLQLSLRKGISGNKTIKVTTKSALNITIKTNEYILSEGKRLLLWKGDPAEVREIANSSHQPQAPNYPAYQKIFNQYSDLDKFEKVQAEWAITQLGKGMPVQEKTS